MKNDVHSRHYKHKRRIIIGFSAFVLILLYTFKNTSFTIRALSTVGLLVVFYLADHLFDIKFKPKHYVFIFIIAISSFLLSPLYYIDPNYDKIQHFVLPIFFCSIVFYIINYLKIEMKWKVIFTFFVVIGVIGLHEIGEYLLDYFFDMKTQGVFLRSVQGLEKYNILMDRIDDTMIDMILGTLGAAVYSIQKLIVYKFKRH